MPTDTLFVVNFDPENTQERDLEKHFSSYGRLKRVQVKRNFGFVQFESLDDAIAARNGLSLSRLLGVYAYMHARIHIEIACHCKGSSKVTGPCQHTGVANLAATGHSIS